jgi:hypothetical protein
MPCMSGGLALGGVLGAWSLLGTACCTPASLSSLQVAVVLAGGVVCWLACCWWSVVQGAGVQSTTRTGGCAGVSSLSVIVYVGKAGTAVTRMAGRHGAVPWCHATAAVCTTWCTCR